MLPAGVRAGHEAVRDLVPAWMQLDRRDREDEQAEAEVAEQPLDPLERERPRGDDESDDPEQDQQPVREPGEKLQRDRDAADLGRAGHQVHHLGGDQRREPGAEARPLSHEIEHGPLGDRSDPAAHLRVDDHPHDADHDHPQELKAERRTGLRVEDEVAYVDEPADRRENSEGDRKEVLQAHLRPSAIWLLCSAAR